MGGTQFENGQSAHKPQSKLLCKYWITGNCVHGDKCKDLHSWFCDSGFSMITKLEGHNQVVSGDKLFSASKDETLRIWDCHSGQCVNDVKVDGEIQCQLNEGQWLFAGLRNAVKAWNLQPQTAHVLTEKECCQVYSSVRRDVLDEYMSNLGIEKMSIDEVQRIEWKLLDEKMKKWIHAVKIVVQILLNGEKNLCEEIFMGSDLIKEICFIKTAKGCVMHLLNSSAKLFRLLDMSDAVANVLPHLRTLFNDESCEMIFSEAKGVSNTCIAVQPTCIALPVQKLSYQLSFRSILKHMQLMGEILPCIANLMGMLEYAATHYGFSFEGIRWENFVWDPGVCAILQMIRRNAENVAACWKMQDARLEAHVEQMFNGLDDADGAAAVPFDELVGMQGPVFHLVENAFTVLASNMIFLGVIIFVSFPLGRGIQYYLSWALSSATTPVLSIVMPLPESVLSLTNITLKNALTTVANLTNESHEGSLLGQVARMLKVTATGLTEFSNNISTTGNTILDLIAEDQGFMLVIYVAEDLKFKLISHPNISLRGDVGNIHWIAFSNRYSDGYNHHHFSLYTDCIVIRYSSFQ